MDKPAPQKSTEQIIDAIWSLDLEPIKFKLMDRREGQGWNAEEVNHYEKEYKRFLTLLVKHPEKTIAPNKKVDTFWHAHILDTMKYAEDCDKVFGYFLHHYPYFGMRGEEDAARLEQAFETMQALHRDEFGNEHAAYCGVAAVKDMKNPAYCGVASPKENSAAAYCGVASARGKEAVAYCGVASAASGNEAAYCGVAFAASGSEAAYCGLASAKGKDEAAYCGVASKQKKEEAAYCGVASVKSEEEAAYCGVASAMQCGAAITGVKEEASYCGVASENNFGEVAYCGIASARRKDEPAHV